MPRPPDPLLGLLHLELQPPQPRLLLGEQRLGALHLGLQIALALGFGLGLALERRGSKHGLRRRHPLLGKLVQQRRVGPIVGGAGPTRPLDGAQRRVHRSANELGRATDLTQLALQIQDRPLDRARCEVRRAGRGPGSAAAVGQRRWRDGDHRQRDTDAGSPPNPSQAGDPAWHG